MSLARFVRLLPEGFEVVIADVGSAGGLHKRWRPFRTVVSALMFDPREDGAVPEKTGRITRYPMALAHGPGRETLHVTAFGNMSSTLLPNERLMAGFRKKGAHTKVVSSLSFPTDSLDNIARRDRRTIDVLKVDTQGSELDVLRGAAECLRSDILLADVEVSFLERYRGQPLFDDILKFMREAGFQLLDLFRLKRYRYLNAAGVANVSLGLGQRPGCLAYGDAIFFRDEEAVVRRVRESSASEAQILVLKTLTVLLAYGKADLAARMLDRLAIHLADDMRDALRRSLKALAAPRLGKRSMHLVLEYLGRHV